jgi:hypothetical protein
MSKFQREVRYVVVKLKDMSPSHSEELASFLMERSIPTRKCAVVESDWPEYELVWRMIQDRMEGRANAAAQRDVLVDFESLGTAGPFKIVEGRIALPIVTIKDIVQMYDAAPRESEAVAWRIKNYNPMFNGGHAWSFTCDPKSVTTYHEPLYTAPPPPRVEGSDEALIAIKDLIRAIESNKTGAGIDNDKNPNVYKEGLIKAYGHCLEMARRRLKSLNAMRAALEAVLQVKP